MKTEHLSVAEFLEDNTKIVVEVDGVRGVLTYVGDVNCAGCTLEGLCSMFPGSPCRVFSSSSYYMFVPESRLEKGGKDGQKDNA